MDAGDFDFDSTFWCHKPDLIYKIKPFGPMARANPLLGDGDYVKIVTGPGWVDRDGVPREHDDFGSIRVARAKAVMRGSYQELEPGMCRGRPIDRPGRAPAAGLFAEIADEEDSVTVLNQCLYCVEDPEARAGGILITPLHRQAVAEAGLRRLVQLLAYNSTEVMRFMGERNEDIAVEMERVRRLLAMIASQAQCTDIGARGASTQNRGSEVAALGLQLVESLLKPTSKDKSKTERRRNTYRDAFVNAHGIEFIITVLGIQGACQYRKIRKQAISARVAMHGANCMFFLIHGSPGNTAHAVQSGAVEALQRSVEVHGRVYPRTKKMVARVLDVLLTLKEDPAFELESEMQRLAIIAEQPGATIADRVAAAKAAARVQVVRMDRS
jgi:hypothetical protein